MSHTPPNPAVVYLVSRPENRQLASLDWLESKALTNSTSDPWTGKPAHVENPERKQHTHTIPSRLPSDRQAPTGSYKLLALILP